MFMSCFRLILFTFGRIVFLDGSHPVHHRRQRRRDREAPRITGQAVRAQVRHFIRACRPRLLPHQLDRRGQPLSLHSARKDGGSKRAGSVPSSVHHELVCHQFARHRDHWRARRR